MRALLYSTMLVTLLLAVACPHCLAETPDAQMLLTHFDISIICAVPNCGKGDLVIEIAKQSGFLVHGFDTDQTNINEAIKRAHRAKILGDRVVFERLQNTPLPWQVKVLHHERTPCSAFLSDKAQAYSSLGLVHQQ